MPLRWPDGHCTAVQAIIRAVCAIIDAFHFAVPVAGDEAAHGEDAKTDGNVADEGAEGRFHVS